MARNAAICHPDRINYGHGLCSRCYHSKYMKDNRNKYRAARQNYTNNWLIQNRERTNDKRREYVAKARLKALALFGSICQKCGFSDERALQIDHIKGDGQVDRRRGLVGYRFYSALIKGTRSLDGLQLLCANCHVIKQRENKEWTTCRKGITK